MKGKWSEIISHCCTIALHLLLFALIWYSRGVLSALAAEALLIGTKGLSIFLARKTGRAWPDILLSLAVSLLFCIWFDMSWQIFVGLSIGNLLARGNPARRQEEYDSKRTWI
jgi:hypothetical protein